jgi:actin-related protein
VTTSASSGVSSGQMDVDGEAVEEIGQSSYHFDLNYFRENMEIKQVMQDGLVKDWDMLERVWDHAILNHLKVDVKDTPVLLAEKTYNSPSARQKWVIIVVRICRRQDSTFF